MANADRYLDALYAIETLVRAEAPQLSERVGRIIHDIAAPLTAEELSAEYATRPEHCVCGHSWRFHIGGTDGCVVARCACGSFAAGRALVNF